MGKLSSSKHNEVEVVASSSRAEPPPYSRNVDLDDPFRDPSDSNVMHQGLRPVTTEPTSPTTATVPAVPVPSEIVLDEGLPSPLPYRPADLSRGLQNGLNPATTELGLPTTSIVRRPLPAAPTEVVLDEGLPSPLPYRPPGLSRGLQIPSRVSLITWGFSFPKVLLEHGVSKHHWRLFKHELEKFAGLSVSQHLTV